MGVFVNRKGVRKLKAREAANQRALAGQKAGGFDHDARLSGGMENPNELLPALVVARKAARSDSRIRYPARAAVRSKSSVWLTGHGCDQTAGFARFGYAVPPNPSFQRTGFAIR